MTADDDFLSRWSRRKQAAAEAERSSPKNDVAKQPDPATLPQSADAQGEGAEVFDITTLPPVDSITAISDVRDFLRAGVPPDLTRAALRRAWSADPAIRDFIGLAENAWDFTDPNAMPGFGPLDATVNVHQMVEQIISRVGEEAKNFGEAGSTKVPHIADFQQVPAAPSHGENSAGPNVLTDARSDQGVAGTLVAPKDDPEISIASQQERDDLTTEPAQEQKILRRTHGGALPH